MNIEIKPEDIDKYVKQAILDSTKSGNQEMSRFKLIEIEKEPSGSFPDYGSLDLNRETEYRIYQLSEDQYGNKSEKLLMCCRNRIYAKRFLRSCQLIDGIEIKE